jgi:hypothetical protein
VRAVPDPQQRNATATDVGMVAVAILATGLLGEKSAVWITDPYSPTIDPSAFTTTIDVGSRDRQAMSSS